MTRMTDRQYLQASTGILGFMLGTVALLLITDGGALTLSQSLWLLLPGQAPAHLAMNNIAVGVLNLTLALRPRTSDLADTLRVFGILLICMLLGNVALTMMGDAPDLSVPTPLWERRGP